MYQSKEAGIKTLVALDDQGGMSRHNCDVLLFLCCPPVYCCCKNAHIIPEILFAQHKFAITMIMSSTPKNPSSAIKTFVDLLSDRGYCQEMNLGTQIPKINENSHTY